MNTPSKEDDLKALMPYLSKITQLEREILKLKVQNHEYLRSLYLIAMPALPNGSYDKNRNECRKLAEEAIKKVM